jgi:hypothetical protein
MVHALLQTMEVDECALCSAGCVRQPRFLGTLDQTKQPHTRVSKDILCSLINSKLNGIVVMEG